MNAEGIITVRAFRPEDTDACAALANQWVDELHGAAREETPEEVEKSVRENMPKRHALVAECNGVPVGYLTLLTKQELIAAVFVDAAHRKQGAATGLIRHAKEIYPEGLHLWVLEENTKARALYKKLGFTEVIREDSGEEDHKPEFLMKWGGHRAAPVIETERLILRRPRNEDCQSVLGFFQSERARYVGGPFSELEAWHKFAAEIGHWEIRGYGMFAVTQKEDGALIGLIGPWFPNGFPENEIGWLLFEGAEGKGIGFEAASAARDYVFEVLGWETAVSYIHPDNERSIRLAERMGAARDEQAAAPHQGDLVYRHPRPRITCSPFESRRCASPQGENAPRPEGERKRVDSKDEGTSEASDGGVQ